jgi:hypothetical protein
MLDLKPATAGEEACTLQVLEVILARRGEIRILRIGTATVAIAGTEASENEVGGDGPSIIEAIVSAACDMARSDEMARAHPIIEIPEEDEPTLFSW